MHGVGVCRDAAHIHARAHAHTHTNTHAMSVVVVEPPTSTLPSVALNCHQICAAYGGANPYCDESMTSMLHRSHPFINNFLLAPFLSAPCYRLLNIDDWRIDDNGAPYRYGNTGDCYVGRQRAARCDAVPTNRQHRRVCLCIDTPGSPLPPPSPPYPPERGPRPPPPPMPPPPPRPPKEGILESLIGSILEAILAAILVIMALCCTGCLFCYFYDSRTRDYDSDG